MKEVKEMYAIGMCKESDDLYVFGTRKSVQAIYNSLYRNWENGGNLIPLFREKARFSKHRTWYGVRIGEDGLFSVVDGKSMEIMLRRGDVEAIPQDYRSTTPASVLRAWRLDRAKARHRKVSGITACSE